MSSGTIQADYISQATATKIEGSPWSSGSITLYKRSGIVTIKFDGVAFSTVSSRTDMGTVPVGYRPRTEMSFCADGSSNRWFFIASDGVIKIGAQEGSTVWGGTTYVAKED